MRRENSHLRYPENVDGEIPMQTKQQCVCVYIYIYICMYVYVCSGIYSLGRPVDPHDVLTAVQILRQFVSTASQGHSCRVEIRTP